MMVHEIRNGIETQSDIQKSRKLQNKNKKGQEG